MMRPISPVIRLKPPQSAVFTSEARFRILVAGRRFGKTFLSLVELCRAAWSPGRLAWYVAPTYKQAKSIAWKPLKLMTRPYWASKPNETDLRIELITGGTICLRGADNYDSLRGEGLDFLVLDEYASIARESWPEVLRPALADRRGRALFIGTPRGCNHFYDLYKEAQSKPDWASFQFTTEEGGNVSPEELESNAHELDERTYRQEFQASFENLTAGICYWAFDRTKNLVERRYDPRLPLFWSLDFNYNPLCSVIGQREGDRVYILDELALPTSNTWHACEDFLERIGSWGGLSPSTTRISVYGDATGRSHHSSSPAPDWQMVREFFKRYPYKVTYQVRSSNPSVKARVACVNKMLRNQAGESRLFIDPRCKELILDFERVHWQVDLNGNSLPEIDDSDPQRTHLSDALGYMLAAEFLQGRSGEMPYSPPR